MRRKIYNNRERHQYISDNTGLHIFQGEAGYVDGIYEVVEDATILVMVLETTSNLNGTNYLMVYGTGTPAENEAELLAAYNEAKKMPRYLGELTVGPTYTIHKGQTYINNYSHTPRLCTVSGSFSMMNDGAYSSVIPGAEAKATRTTIIVAPGKYSLDAPLQMNANCIDIVSLTGNRDVTLTRDVLNYPPGEANYISVVDIHADNIRLIGIEGEEYTAKDGQKMRYTIRISNFSPNHYIEKCAGGEGSFGPFSGNEGIGLGTFIECEGDFIGENNVVDYGGTYIRCTGQFNAGLKGVFDNCRSTAIFGTPLTGSRLINCVDSDNRIINPIFKGTARLLNGQSSLGTSTTTLATEAATRNGIYSLGRTILHFKTNADGEISLGNGVNIVSHNQACLARLSTNTTGLVVIKCVGSSEIGITHSFDEGDIFIDGTPYNDSSPYELSAGQSIVLYGAIIQEHNQFIKIA